MRNGFMYRWICCGVLAAAVFGGWPVFAATGGVDTPSGVTELPLSVEGQLGVDILKNDTVPPTVLIPGNVAIGTTAPGARLDVNGEVKINSTGLVCSAATAGGLRYNGTTSQIEYCNGTQWQTPNTMPLTVVVRGAKIPTPLIQAGFEANDGANVQRVYFPIPFAVGTYPVVVLNRNYTPGGSDTDNFACYVTNTSFQLCGDAREWTGRGSDSPPDRLKGHKWIAVGVGDQ